LIAGVCRRCGLDWVRRLSRHEITVLTILSVTALAGFVVTRSAAVAAERQRIRDAESWGSEELRALRETVDLVLTTDPLSARISTAERRRRIAAALEWADQFIRRCPAADDSAEVLLEKVLKLKEASRTRRQEVLALAESTMAVMGRTISDLPTSCRSSDSQDRAWMLIYERHQAATG
jgi:hypothetical protein